MSETQPPVDIYQFRLSIKDISPAIWRRVLVRSDSTLADLHYIIQILMSWSNFYLISSQSTGNAMRYSGSFVGMHTMPKRYGCAI